MVPRIIHQFWDRPDVPADVVACLQTFRSNHPDWEHVLWHDDEASGLIREHFGADAEREFLACTIAAMRADLFRLAVMLVIGGVYADADMTSRRPIDRLIAAETLLYRRGHAGKPLLLSNEFLLSTPGHVFFERGWTAARRNIVRPPQRSISARTGPAMLTKVWTEELTDDERASVTLLDKGEILPFVKAKKDLRYMSEGGNWKAQSREGGKLVKWERADAIIRRRERADLKRRDPRRQGEQPPVATIDHEI